MNFLKQVEEHTPPVIVGFATYSGFKFILEAFGVIDVSVNPFDTISILSVGFLYMFEKHIPYEPSLCLCASRNLFFLLS